MVCCALPTFGNFNRTVHMKELARPFCTKEEWVGWLIHWNSENVYHMINFRVKGEFWLQGSVIMNVVYFVEFDRLHHFMIKNYVCPSLKVYYTEHCAPSKTNLEPFDNFWDERIFTSWWKRKATIHHSQIQRVSDIEKLLNVFAMDVFLKIERNLNSLDFLHDMCMHLEQRQDHVCWINTVLWGP